MSERDRFIEENIGLVHTCAKRFHGRGPEYEDLFQAGCVGLVKAVDHFEPERGFCFSTYAVPLIIGEMRRLFRDGGSVRVSRSIRELSLKASRVREELTAQWDREPTVSEIASRLERTPEEVAQALSAGLPTLSLTRSGEEDDGEQIDLPGEAIEERITDRLALQQVLSELEGRDRALIVLRYLKSETQQKTAEQLGMTQVQVSRRERAILETMRKKLIS
ncbi:MAG: sigma-70 family RNA polymerase sigma factor [Clostridia bacterium]|nr:sigma-70 family RNA polymerase sigma factor [Clostridia bacterium]